MLKNKGWTIIEAMVVLALMGIIIGISMPRLQNYVSKTRLDGAKNEVLSILRVARANALSEQRTYQVVFEEATNTYRILPGGASKSLPEGIKISSSSDVTYSFYADRTASVTPGKLTIVNSKGSRVVFTLVPATGYIEGSE